ncbi:hypothetical protein GJAV_G00084770 [Gymnothorax javanicus]|nr:hypothetical protein GJAV_G00084770 [Gymnothorax javanicus]
MMSALLTLLGVLLCAMNTHANAVPQKDFNLEKMGGKWYLFGIASNSEWFTAKKSEMKVGTVTMTPTATGDLSLSLTGQKSNGTCWKMTHLAEKTETPGKFTFYNQCWKNDNDMRIVDVKYDEYALVHTTKTKAGVSAVQINLYTRGVQPSPELVKKFQELSKEAAILPENTVILPKNGECPMD